MKTKTSMIFAFAILMVTISTLAAVNAATSSATPTPTPTPTPAPHVMGIASSAPYFVVLVAIVVLGALAYGMVQRKRNNAKND